MVLKGKGASGGGGRGRGEGRGREGKREGEVGRMGLTEVVLMPCPVANSSLSLLQFYGHLFNVFFCNIIPLQHFKGKKDIAIKFRASIQHARNEAQPH